MNRITTGRSWAYVGVVVGAGVSVLANVAHSYVPPPHALTGWVPEAGAVVATCTPTRAARVSRTAASLRRSMRTP